jgi:hypothetical protein
LQTLKRASGWCELVWMHGRMDFRASKPKPCRGVGFGECLIVTEDSHSSMGLRCGKVDCSGSQQRWHHGYLVLFIRRRDALFYLQNYIIINR